MDKIPFCIECAFRLNIESNPKVIVMSTNSMKPESRCYKCQKGIGHLNELNRLIGIYHKRRHEEHEEPRKNSGLAERFRIYQKNKYNGDTLSYFIMAIQYQRYGEDTIRRNFSKLVREEDMYIYDRRKLINELLEITNRQVSKTIKNEVDLTPFI